MRDTRALLAHRYGVDSGMNSACVLTFLLSVLLAPLAGGGQSSHKITVTFDYDFTHQAPCSSDSKHKHKKRKLCVQDFVAYDISAGVRNRTKLVSIPVAQNAHGLVNGITATTPPLLFESGRHLIAVVAQTSEGVESDPSQCTVWVNIPD